MADFTASGAGTAGVNGDYTENGTSGGFPAYELAGGAFWIYTVNSGVDWFIDTVKGTIAPLIYYSSSTGITGTWTSAAFGADPGPTIVAAVSGVPIPILINSYRERRI